MIEDAAQTLMFFTKINMLITFGDLVALSFYTTKPLHAVNVIITDDEELRNECYRLKNHKSDKKGPSCTLHRIQLLLY